MKKQRDRLAERLAAYDRPRPSDDLEPQIQAATDRFWRPDEDVDKANPLKLRKLVNQIVCRIDLHFDHVRKGNSVECPFSRQVITLRPAPVLYRLVNRGNGTPIELFVRQVATWPPQIAQMLVAA